MSDENKKKSAQSVDEIVDDLAADMGVEDHEVPEEAADDAMASLGGVFNVSSSKKRRKKKSKRKKEAKAPAPEAEEQPAPVAEPEPEEQVEEAAQAPVEEEVAAAPAEPSNEKGEAVEPAPAKKPAKKATSEAVSGVFNTAGSREDVDLDLASARDYLDEDDLDGVPAGGGTNKVLVLIIVVLLVAMGAIIFQFTDLGDDLIALMHGELREKRNAEVAQQEAAFKAEQLEKMEKFGTLMITGEPSYARIKLDGQIQYGQTSSGAWREVQLVSPSGAQFRNLKVKSDHTLEVSAPGHKSETMELTEGMWSGDSTDPYGYTKSLSMNLMPQSGQDQMEFDQRMDTTMTDEEYNGTVTISSVPAGAEITFNNHPLVDKDGEPLVTPVTFDKYYVKDEKTGKLKENTINVSTPPDVGHKIELNMPEEEGEYPAYVEQLQRRMWSCDWKDGQAPESPPSGKSYREFCDYTYKLEMDFEGLKTYIERREAEIARVKEENEKLQAVAEEAEEEAE